MNKRLMALMVVALAGSARAAPFGQGNLVVVRVGSAGSTTNLNNSTRGDCLTTRPYALATLVTPLLRSFLPTRAAMRNKNTKERYFVTWQDTLHPENALLVPNDLPATAGQVDRWGTVWAEARIISDDEATSSTQSSSIGVEGKRIASDEASIAVAPMPVAEVTLGNIEDDYETVTTDDATNSLPNRHAAAAAAASRPQQHQQPQQSSQPHQPNQPYGAKAGEQQQQLQKPKP